MLNNSIIAVAANSRGDSVQARKFNEAAEGTNQRQDDLLQCVHLSL